MANNEFEIWKSTIKRANKEAKFWDYAVDGKRCLIVHSYYRPASVTHPTSYSVCHDPVSQYSFEGDIVTYPDLLAEVKKTMEDKSCPVVEVHKHLNTRHAHIFCDNKSKKEADTLIDTLKWF